MMSPFRHAISPLLMPLYSDSAARFIRLFLAYAFILMLAFDYFDFFFFFRYAVCHVYALCRFSMTAIRRRHDYFCRYQHMPRRRFSPPAFRRHSPTPIPLSGTQYADYAFVLRFLSLLLFFADAAVV